MKKFWDENGENLTYFFAVIGLFIIFVAMGLAFYYIGYYIGQALR